jgi:hypothetical protein
MGFIQPDLAAVDPDTFLQKPLMERMRILAIDWGEKGFGSPKMIHTMYIVKLVLFAIGGITVATATSGLPAFWHVTEWWNQPIVYQKVILWTVLLETIGVAGSWGPLAGKAKPFTGGIVGQHIRAGEPRPAGRADRAAGADRSARQDHLPGRPRRAVLAGAVLFRRAAVRQHDYRAQDADRGGLGRRRLLEVR